MAHLTLSQLTNEWFPDAPRAYEKSVVLGGGLVLFPQPDPEATAEVLKEYAEQLAHRAYRAGRQAAKAEIRAALFDQ